MSREFNLLREPWIRVFNRDYSVSEVSLSEALLNAEKYVDLAGELPTQDIAVLRQLLAVLYAVFLREDAEGNPEEIESVNDAFDRWDSIWSMGRFPQESLIRYFDKWQDRFWLFDDEHPFGQVNEAKIGTAYLAAKMNGELSESSNKDRLFPVRAGSGKGALNFAEAARWLLYVNAYDDTSAKPKGKNLPSVGAGWLGKIGPIQAVGENLFETLMLNLVLVQDGSELWGEGCPNWELDLPRSGERTEIPVPQNPAALLTLQSRRLLLQKNESTVTGFTLLGGDFFPKEGAFAEQMTIWVRRPGKKNEPDIIQPKRHDASRQIWRDLSSIVAQTVDGSFGRLPGVVSWVKQLRSNGLINRKQIIHFRIAAVQYGDKDFFVTDVFGDSLAFHTDLLTQSGDECRMMALEEIKRCDTIVWHVGRLADEISKAAGFDPIESNAESAKEELYFRLDEPFRLWLEKLDPDDPDVQEDMRKSWRLESERIALEYGRELVDQAGLSAFKGRYVQLPGKKGGEGERVHYSTAEAFNKYQRIIRKLTKGTEE